LRFNLLWLAGVIGLGLTNHLTTLFLLPPAMLALLPLGIFWPEKDSGTQRGTEKAQSSTESDYRSLLTDYRFLAPTCPGLPAAPAALRLPAAALAGGERRTDGAEPLC
jgi:hypothetical protein